MTDIIVGEVPKEAFNLPDKHLEMLKFRSKVHEYLHEVDKLFINLRRTKET